MNNLDNLRHSCAHLIAAAVLDLYPEAILTLGPSIENGFYYDFDNLKVSESDLPAIEAKMHEIVKSWSGFKKEVLSYDQAKKRFAKNPYKLEIIEQYKDQELSAYKSGEFSDLCRGGHCEHPDHELKYFKLMSIAGAYWRGDEKNKMLTRIYGTCWSSQKELDHYLWQQEEAKKRDHRKLGRELDLFHFQPEAPGIPFWHPKGLIVRNEILDFSRKVQKEYGYKEVQTPIMMDVEIFKQSGHWDHYRNDMFFTDYEKRSLALKPMNCPGMIQIYKSSPKSYRDLPLFLSEYGLITRKEKSGELNGLFRVMQATQDDAHLFISQDGIASALQSLISLVNDIYKVFGIKFKAYLSTRPDDFMGKIETWDLAEKTLKGAMNKAGLELLLKEKDGAFYGPKIDYQLEDSLGRTWQCATLQLDFQMPQTFGLEYVDKDGISKMPVMIHRTIIGSFERFIGILTEHYGGAFPVWLAPVQVSILPISEKHMDYAQKVFESLKSANIRCELDSRNESLGAKIRDAEMQKVPFILVTGDKEVQAQSVSVRRRGQKESQDFSVSEFIINIQKEIASKSNTSTTTSNS